MTRPAGTGPSAPATESAGAGLPRVLGEYDLLERLGGGGMGEVFVARHRRLGGRAALKVLNARHSASPEAIPAPPPIPATPPLTRIWARPIG